MKPLYESILSKTGTGAEQSIRKWLESTKLDRWGVKLEIKPVKGGYYAILDSFEHQPQLGTFYLDKSNAHDIPKSLRGAFYQHYAAKNKPDYLAPIRFIFGNTSYNKFEIPNLDFTQDSKIILGTFFDPIQFSYSNADEIVGKITAKNSDPYALKFMQSYIHKKLSLELDGQSTIYLHDGTVINMHNIKGCKVHKLVFGDTMLAHTAALDRNELGFDPYDQEGARSTLLIRHGSNFITNKWLTGILQELEMNNKIDVFEYIGDMIPSKRGTSVMFKWYPKLECYISIR